MGVTSTIAEGELPPDATLSDLGEHRLQDLTRPERVHQLNAPGLGATFPPLRSLNALATNLPLELTSFQAVSADRTVGTSPLRR